jgi:hypothetical protein
LDTRSVMMYPLCAGCNDRAKETCSIRAVGAQENCKFNRWFWKSDLDRILFDDNYKE